MELRQDGWKGRIMPRGAPDYSNVTGGDALTGFYDQGEMAARLGSPVVYDKSGILVWYTDFEHGLQGHSFVTDHTDSVGSITASRAYHGSFSAKFDPRNADDSYVRLSRVLALLPAGRVGYELSLSPDTDLEKVRLLMWYRDEGRELYGALEYTPEGGVWKIKDRDVSWTPVLEDFELQQGPGAWHPIKLVINTNTKKYTRLLVSRHAVPLTDYNLYDTATDRLGQLEIRVSVYGTTGTHAPAYIDGIIITKNEP